MREIRYQPGPNGDIERKPFHVGIGANKGDNPRVVAARTLAKEYGLDICLIAPAIGATTREEINWAFDIHAQDYTTCLLGKIILHQPEIQVLETISRGTNGPFTGYVLALDFDKSEEWSNKEEIWDRLMDTWALNRIKMLKKRQGLDCFEEEDRTEFRNEGEELERVFEERKAKGLAQPFSHSELIALTKKIVHREMSKYCHGGVMNKEAIETALEEDSTLARCVT